MTQSSTSTPAPAGGGRPHVVIIGAGFGGLATAAGLGGKSGIRVTVIDRRNYHLFVPLLYQVATAALSPADIAEPIRRILSRYRNIEVQLAEVTGIDPKGRTVLLDDGRSLSYDRLVIATGATQSYFGHEEWSEFAPGLKTLDDARRIRARLLTAFEQAEMCEDPTRQCELMTTVIIGGGPTGVELAGSVAELARWALVRDFRRIDPRTANILLVEAGPRLLSGFPDSLARYAARALARLNVTVLTGEKVEGIDERSVTIGGRHTRAGTVIWAAGVRATRSAEWLGITPDRSGRIPVAPDLSVEDCSDIYALGDIALARGDDGKPLPGLAQVAKQQGEHLGAALAAELTQGKPVPPFRFRNRGNTAIIGRHAAVFDFGRQRLRGWPAWALWAIVHIYLLIGFEKRLSVGLQWLWRYLTYQRGARLILGDIPPPAAKHEDEGPP